MSVCCSSHNSYSLYVMQRILEWIFFSFLFLILQWQFSCCIALRRILQNVTPSRS
ncbi:hypothetical protein EV363DRAFT_1158204 [Boletus edulis]|uniref:Uncharacterized protein n=1 Tax=Boletus edulis BED1 TaxID=1328754 RepID=A0AAD4C4N4_BOLED|nr:hypothetical protein EV363DRAFT_1158204 [Boletus edulis]KAF8447632.1 hypothetical protein L210DRAFT_3526858 [Boletus edulis BED1]